MSPSGCHPSNGLVTEAELHAWMDGELPPDRAAAVEAHLRDHPEDLRRLESYRSYADLIAVAYAPLAVAPATSPLPPVPQPPRQAWLTSFAAVAAALLLFMAGTAAGWLIRETLIPPVASSVTAAGSPDAAVRDAVTDESAHVASEAVVAHRVYATDIRHPVEVGADQEAHMIAWLSRRLGVPLTVPKLTEIGFDLLGGRLLTSEDGPAAQFMYQDPSGRRITIYVCRSSGGQDVAFRLTEIDGIAALYWHENTLWWAVAGDIDRSTLSQVAHTTYAALNR